MKELLLTPPSVVIDADIAWLLLAAFADKAGDSCPHNVPRSLQLARATELSGRVAKRLLAASKAGALGNELQSDYHANAAKEALLLNALERITQLAASSGVQLIAVKFAGLRLAGVTAAGTRVVADLDLLLPAAESRRFWRSLLDAGFRRTHAGEYAHQLEALVDPYGAEVDLHVHLPGVFSHKGGYMTAERLIAGGLVTRTADSVLVPVPAVLAAHAIAHALLQNRSTPQTYSPLRMVSDLMDLRRVEPAVVSSAADFLAPELRPICEALDRLCDALSKGIFSGVGFDGKAEQTLLWHCIAARLDEDYSERLRAAGLANKFRDGASAIEITRYVADLLYPSEAALDALYGPALGWRARLRRRLFRPVDLVARARLRRSRR